MTQPLLKACFLNTSINFLTPEPELFTKSLIKNTKIDICIFNVDKKVDLSELMDRSKEFDLFIVDSWALLHDSQFFTGGFRESHIYQEDFETSCKQLSIFKKWATSAIKNHLKEKIFFLYSGALDYWRIHNKDLSLLKNLLESQNFILWSPDPIFCSEKSMVHSYNELIKHAKQKDSFLELRHAIDLAYDYRGRHIEKIYLINMLPSLSPERINMFNQLKGIMCNESRELYRESINALVIYKKHLSKFNLNHNLEMLPQLKREKSYLMDLYRKILILSKTICTTPTRYSAFIRKYVEVPNANCLLIAPRCGWEDKIFRGIKYPLIDYNDQFFNSTADLIEIKYNNSSAQLELVQSYLEHFNSYEKRIDNLLDYFVLKN